jgi:Helicase conserved C-terminal domain
MNDEEALVAETLSDPYAVRAELVDRLRRDLVGPQEERETLTEAPFRTYVSGVLYPATAGSVDPEEEVDEPDDDMHVGETGFADPPVSLANTRYPSSMGLTFAVDTAASQTLTVTIDTARYEAIGDEPNVTWRRLPLRFDQSVDVTAPISGEERPLEPGLGLYVRVRAADALGRAAVTLVLINRREAAPGHRDADSYFQAGMRVAHDGEVAFVERRTDDLTVADDDLESYRLIYRDVRSFAVGHGVSVGWTIADDAPSRATEVHTTALPTHELRLADSNRDIPTEGLTMLGLGTGDRSQVTRDLRDLLDHYDVWIERQRDVIAGLDEQLQATARTHLDDCATALARMRSGVARLEADDDVLRAFQLANRAMLRQRARARWIAAGSGADGPVEDDSHRWRPFQIAFILLNLDGIADPRHPDRETLDLLWFPTGGGKTEAYLGLLAICVLLRRRRLGELGAGVTVLMRYTLRLLTIQQFERACSLICALEALRRELGDELGSDEISIGLWVGKGGTPSRIDDAKDAIAKIRLNQEVAEGNPMQVRACPWCGTPLGHRAYWFMKSEPRMVISCPNQDCTFHKGLPIHVVDEDLYRAQPTLVIATADKFATLPWVKDAHRLFAVDDRVPPPELIIQDELHLISGPLGTLAGLYEAAVDILCTHDDVRPKVVASTATIRRAARQTEALFDRPMRQFPPLGLDADNSFFAVAAPADRKPTRLYVGALAPGTSQSTLLIRAYAALMQTIAEVDATDAARDPYWTLVGYFNSLRVLGGARIQVLDDVRDRLQAIARDGAPRPLPRSIELTSREPSSAIPGHLAALDLAYPNDEALDYVLATNMISVGVDIDRLGLMVVAGQPQATAEYIQATSRVGRQHPGLVITLYNAGRSRDRSHYENFPSYHQALYRQVESTSVTPFAPRARDRALDAVMISLARTAIPALRPNAAARDVELHLDRLRAFADRLAARAERISPGVGATVRSEIEELLTQRWMGRADEAPALVYTNPYDSVNSLLSPADQAEGDGLPTPSSLRDVDSESNLHLVRV